jgi:hypothetical protein
MKTFFYKDEEYLYNLYRDCNTLKMDLVIFKKTKKSLFNWLGRKAIWLKTNVPASKPVKEILKESMEEYFKSQKVLVIDCSPEIHALYE